MCVCVFSRVKKITNLNLKKYQKIYNIKERPERALS